MPTKAFFLDRDGVINKEVGNLSRVQDFKMYPFAPEAIQKIHQAGYLAIIITNQPMVAKGFMTEKEVEGIHEKLQTDLAAHGQKIDAIYYCPHHPEKGFEGEVPELKISCNCRKPKTGMIGKAQQDFNIDLVASFFIGDTTTDAKTAQNLGIPFVGVKTGYGMKDDKYPLEKEFPIQKDLLGAIDFLLKS